MAISERNPGCQFERTAKGELVVAPTSSEVGRRDLELGYQLKPWSDRTGLGVAFGPSTGWNLPDGSCRSPNASWVALARWVALPPADRRGFAHLCPDAVFELRSPSASMAELRAKMRMYLEHGARLGVLIDPEAQAVEVHRPGRAPERVEDAQPAALDPELPGFTLELRQLFA